ncbi:MAG: hypothetical protein U9Q22_04465, partial [Candidatus Altiarchaeota archaeon]|nr:hypothetical protein [Candidatus Altiarchaeota archaeon]
MKKGYVLTLDAILALTVVLMVSFMVFEVQNSVGGVGKMGFKRIHYVSEDAIGVLNKKGVLDQICTEWAVADGNTSSPHWSTAGDV